MERTKNKGKKQEPSAVRQAAICFNKNILRTVLGVTPISRVILLGESLSLSLISIITR